LHLRKLRLRLRGLVLRGAHFGHRLAQGGAQPILRGVVGACNDGRRERNKCKKKQFFFEKKNQKTFT